MKDIINKPDYIIEDNKNKDTMLYLKNLNIIDKRARVVIKLAIEQDDERNKNSIITIMKLNKRT